MKRSASFVAVLAALALLAAIPASASHSWGSYHWARASNPFTVALGSNLDSSWSAYLDATSSDWSRSQVLDTSVVTGGSRNKNCSATAGRVEVCNGWYGYNGWLGVAQIWVSGDHITQGTVKVNDSYFGAPKYNTPQWRQSVLCQEVGHTFGLDHQSEDPNVNTGSCMDYYKVPNTRPNQHDYDQLESIYGHSDTAGGGSGCKGKGCHHGGGAPEKVDDDLWVEDLGGGVRRFTHVFWVEHGVPHDFPQNANG